MFFLMTKFNAFMDVVEDNWEEYQNIKRKGHKGLLEWTDRAQKHLLQ
jgi:hypothetical protein